MGRGEMVAVTLALAADRISKGWTTCATARDFAGRVVQGSDASAVCWCICAAVEVSLSGDLSYEECLEPLGGDLEAIRYNDVPGRTQEEVVSFLLKHSRALRALSADASTGANDGQG